LTLAIKENTIVEEAGLFEEIWNQRPDMAIKKDNSPRRAKGMIEFSVQSRETTAERHAFGKDG
jgi:hypothetical protein